MLSKFNQLTNQPDLGKLFLRLGFAGLFLLHGIAKMQHGVGFVSGKFMEIGLPGELAYLAYLAEVVAPILIILGLFTRIAAFVALGGCGVIMLLMHGDNFFALSKVGAWVVEDVATFAFGFLAIMLLGSGKYALKAD